MPRVKKVVPVITGTGEMVLGEVRKFRSRNKWAVKGEVRVHLFSDMYTAESFARTVRKKDTRSSYERSSRRKG
jgi:hypothetical protein